MWKPTIRSAHRPWLQIVLIAFLLPPRAATAQAQDWSQFQGNPAHTGYVPVSFDPANLTLAWSAPAPEDSAAPEWGVAIDSRRVYATMREESGGFGLFHVRAFDPRTGAEL